ncbi:hypothetical protein ABOA58_21970 [Peribacillus frigoritolerans]
MNFKGKANSGTNADGWERNAKKFSIYYLKVIRSFGVEKIRL